MHYGKFLKSAVLLGSVSLLIGCGSSGSSKHSSKVGYKGVFVDSAVSGISYSCGGVTGVTDENGVFGVCPAGSDVTFSVGNVVLGTVSPTADNIFTPQDVVGVPRGTTDNDEVNKMAALLLSLDADGDPTNGVSITSEIVTAFEAVVAEGTTMETLDIESAVTATSAHLSDITLDPVSVVDAASHLIETATSIEAGDIVAPTQPESEDASTN